MTISSINPKYDIGNNQTPETRTMHKDRHGTIALHVCNEELWRFAEIKKDLESGRYDNLPPANLADFKRHKKKFKRGAKYGRGSYPA